MFCAHVYFYFFPHGGVSDPFVTFPIFATTHESAYSLSQMKEHGSIKLFFRN